MDSGDERILTEETLALLQHYFAQAMRIYRKKGLTEADAEDCASEVRLCLLRHVQKGGTLSYAYFLRVVQGCLADFLHAPSPTLPLEDAIMCGGGEVFPYIEIDVRLALEQLKPEARELILLHDVEGYSIEQLAQRYGCRAHCLRQRLHRARQQLKKLLE